MLMRIYNLRGVSGRASTPTLWGIPGHYHTPEPAKRPAFNTAIFGSAIAIA
jgi:hypothetical protein